MIIDNGGAETEAEEVAAEEVPAEKVALGEATLGEPVAAETSAKEGCAGSSEAIRSHMLCAIWRICSDIWTMLHFTKSPPRLEAMFETF